MSCGRNGDNSEAQNPVSYASHDPGSDPIPTNDDSYQLMALDPLTRLTTTRALVVQAGQRCSAVTKAVLEGGLDGTDEWRVTCADTGEWQLWLRPNSERDLVHCHNEQCT
jgi:hypothetical protein